MTPMLQPSRQAASVTLISPSAAGGRRGGGCAGAGGPAQVRGLPDPGAAAGLDLIVPRDAEPATGAAGGQLCGVEPVVDDAGAAAEPAGGLGHGDLVARVGRRCGDVVGVADPLDGLDVERAPVAGPQPGGVQLPGQLGGERGRARPGNHLPRWAPAAPRRTRVDGPGRGWRIGRPAVATGTGP